MRRARCALSALRADVERAAGDAAPALRWVAAAVAHLTLHFLGEVDSGRLARASWPRSNLLCRVRLSSVTLGPLGRLTTERTAARRLDARRRPARGRSRRYIATLGERLMREGIAIERRPFTPHLTLARVRDREQRRARALGERLRDIRMAPIGWRIDHVTLFRSDLSGPDATVRGGAYHHARRLPGRRLGLLS